MRPHKMKASERVLLQEKAAFAKVEPPCPYVGTCGGCTIQDLSYPDQITLKRQRLLTAFGALDPTLTIEVLPMDEPWRYRNKAELTFGVPQARPEGRSLRVGTPHGDSEHPTLPGSQVGTSWMRDAGGPQTARAADGLSGTRVGFAGASTPEPALYLGYHAARSFWRIVDLEDCLLLPEAMREVLKDARKLAAATRQPAYNPKTHQGFFRYLVLRSSHATGKLLVSLVTTQGERSLIESFADALLEGHPEITSFYWGLNAKVADVAIPDELRLIRGTPYLEDRIGPFQLQLHPLNFLQPNPLQAVRLYERLCEWVSHVPQGVAWDLYCGIGLVAFYLAEHYQTVYGIDSDAHNLEMARLNASANDISNIQFHLGRVEDLLLNKRFWIAQAKPDLVVIDPPRSGLHGRVASSLLAARPKQMVYVSCNVQTLIRDLKLLLSGFPRYRLRQAVAFDLFPHTNHLEILTLLERV